MQYGNQGFSQIFTQVQTTLFPAQWTIADNLSMMRQSMVLMLMVLVSLLDLTVDAAINNIDPNEKLKVCL